MLFRGRPVVEITMVCVLPSVGWSPSLTLSGESCGCGPRLAGISAQAGLRESAYPSASKTCKVPSLGVFIRTPVVDPRPSLPPGSAPIPPGCCPHVQSGRGVREVIRCR